MTGQPAWLARFGDHWDQLDPPTSLVTEDLDEGPEVPRFRDRQAGRDILAATPHLSHGCAHTGLLLPGKGRLPLRTTQSLTRRTPRILLLYDKSVVVHAATRS